VWRDDLETADLERVVQQVRWRETLPDWMRGRLQRFACVPGSCPWARTDANKETFKRNVRALGAVIEARMTVDKVARKKTGVQNEGTPLEALYHGSNVRWGSRRERMMHVVKAYMIFVMIFVMLIAVLVAMTTGALSLCRSL